MNERARIAEIVTTFDRPEIEAYPHGREAFLIMVARELQNAAGGNIRLEFGCTPRFGEARFEMRATPKSLT